MYVTVGQLCSELGLDVLTAEFTKMVLEGRWDLSLVVAYRDDCRKRRDYKTADRLRVELVQHGYLVRDRGI